MCECIAHINKISWSSTNREGIVSNVLEIHQLPISQITSLSGQQQIKYTTAEQLFHTFKHDTITVDFLSEQEVPLHLYKMSTL